MGLPLTVEQNEEEAVLGAAISAFAMIESISMAMAGATQFLIALVG